MRVLVIAPHYNTFVKGSIEAIAKRVKRVDVLVHHNRFTSLLKYVPLGGYIDYARRFTRDKLLNLEGKPENVRVHFISKFYFPPSFRNLKVGDIFAKEMLKIIDNERIEADVIHSHFIWPPGYIGAKIKPNLDAKLVITGHGYDVYDLPFRGDEWMERIRWALSQTDAVTTVSRSNLKVLTEKLGVDVSKAHLIPNGVSSIFKPIDGLYARNELGIKGDAQVILSVGSFIEIKGHEYLIKAVKKLKDSGFHVLTYIIGEGSFKERLIKLVRKLDLTDSVRIVGPRPHSEIPLWMNAADVLALPSLKEGTPTVMLEALACGTPLVGSRVGGIPDIITSEEYGILVEPKNTEELTKAILEAFNKEWDRKKIADYGSQFYWDKISEKIIDLYENLLRFK